MTEDQAGRGAAYSTIVLMHDDIRQTARPRRASMLGSQATAAVVNTRAKIVPPVPVVDEAKIEEEFGPPVDGIETPKPRMGMKLLPALTRSRPSRRALVILAVAGIVLVGAASAASYTILSRYKPAVIQTILPAVPKKPPVPTTVASTLSGLPVDPSVNNRPVTAVMIENSIDARPQSGLDQAGVVFEAIAEGGVTRFMALFQDTQPDYIGPVRSARPYYIQWALGFDAAYAHVGGSPDGLADITSWNVKDMNEFYNAGAYERISSRYAPHNVYTSIAQLSQVENSKGYGKSNYTGFARKKEAPSKTPTATSIDLTFSGYYYDAHFDYAAATNSYNRSEAGQPHMELHKDGSQVQISPKVVVAMVVPRQNGVLDSTGAYYSDYATIGSGPITVFQDGITETGTWTKTSNAAPLTFTDAQGQPLQLNPGQTWISVIAASSDVTYK